MTTCQKTGCSSPATHGPVLIVPAKGWSVEMHQPLRMEIGLALCEPHAKAATVADLVTDEGWGMIRRALASLGKAEPDRERIKVEAVPIARRF